MGAEREKINPRGCHSWGHSWVKFRFRLLCVSPSGSWPAHLIKDQDLREAKGLTGRNIRTRQSNDKVCNLCGHLQRCQMPDIENSRKTAEKGEEWLAAKQPKNSRKNSRNSRFGCSSGCFLAVSPRATWHPFRLFFGSIPSMTQGYWHVVCKVSFCLLDVYN